MAACTPDFACNNGSCTPCAEGFYSYSSFTVAERAECESCESGYYCALASSAIEPNYNSPIQAFFAPSAATSSAEYYCPNGLRLDIGGSRIL